MVVELFFWNQLPNKIATHFNFQMTADSWSSKPAAIFVLPFIMTLVQLFMINMVATDAKNQNLPNWAQNIVYFIIPIISAAISFYTLSTSLGDNPNHLKGIFLNLLGGVMLIIVGIVLKQVQPNQTIGIRVPWTLHSQKNWQMTHQLGSKVYIIGGIVALVSGLFSWNLLLIPTVLIVIIVPIVYSYYLHRHGI